MLGVIRRGSKERAWFRLALQQQVRQLLSLGHALGVLVWTLVVVVW